MLSSEPKTKKLLKLLGKVFLALIVLGLLAWFLIISPYLTRQEKARFESAHSELEKLAQEIQTKVGTAESVTDSSTCDRPNLKSAKGPLGCSTGLKLTYTVANNLGANIILTTVVENSMESLRPGPLTDATEFTSEQKRSAQIIYQDIPSLSDLSCAISYEYYSPESKLENKDGLLDVILSCFGPALAEYYSVED